jgi:hypothetical protein
MPLKISTVHSAPKKTSICKATEFPQDRLLSFGIVPQPRTAKQIKKKKNSQANGYRLKCSNSSVGIRSKDTI